MKDGESEEKVEVGDRVEQEETVRGHHHHHQDLGKVGKEEERSQLRNSRVPFGVDFVEAC